MDTRKHDVEISPLYEAAFGCHDSLQKCLREPLLMNSEWAENKLAQFNLWAADIGIFRKNRSAVNDSIFREYGKAQPILNALVLLRHYIQTCLELCASLRGAINAATFVDRAEVTLEGWPTTSDHVQNLASPKYSQCIYAETNDGSVRQQQNELPSQKLCAVKEDVNYSISQLPILSDAARYVCSNSRFQEADEVFRSTDYSQLRSYLEEHVRARGAGRETNSDTVHITPIQRRLIDANLRRRNRFLYFQNRSQRCEMGIAGYRGGVYQKLSETTIDDCFENTSANTFNKIFEDSESDTIAVNDGDSDGSSGWSGSSKTSCVMKEQKQITGLAAESVYPKPPRVYDEFRSFECPYCCVVLPSAYQEETLWQQHLMDDIRPFTCIIESCPHPELLYMCRSDWLQHVLHGHEKCWECLLCSAPDAPPNLFPTIKDFTQHTKDKHAAAIPKELLRNSIIFAAERHVPFGINQCPLCDHKGVPDSDMLLDHIAEHILAFSMKSLPNQSPGVFIDDDNSDAALKVPRRDKDDIVNSPIGHALQDPISPSTSEVQRSAAHKDVTKRFELNELNAAGSWPDDATSDFIRQLKNPNPYVRKEAARCITKIYNGNHQNWLGFLLSELAQVIGDWFQNRESPPQTILAALWILFLEWATMVVLNVGRWDLWLLFHDPQFDGTLVQALVYELIRMAPELLFGIDRVMVLHDEPSQNPRQAIVHRSTWIAQSTFYGQKGVIKVRNVDLSSLKPPEVIIKILESLEQHDSDRSVRRSAKRALDAINSERRSGETPTNST